MILKIVLNATKNERHFANEIPFLPNGSFCVRKFVNFDAHRRNLSVGQEPDFLEVKQRRHDTQHNDTQHNIY